MHEESADGCGSVDSAKGVLDVCGDEKFVGCSESHCTEVVNHAVGSTLHEGTILVGSNSADDVGLGDVKYDTSGKFEQHFKQGDGPDARARFLAKWFDLSNEPEIGDVLWYSALSPSEDPEMCGLNAIRCFK